MKIKPIKPNEVVKNKLNSLPDEVIQSFNELIAENWNGSQSVIMKNDAVKRILGKMSSETFTKQMIYDNHYLDVEPIYQDNGWVVEYDNPGYNETYEAKYIFRKR